MTDYEEELINVFSLALEDAEQAKKLLEMSIDRVVNYKMQEGKEKATRALKMLLSSAKTLQEYFSL